MGNYLPYRLKLVRPNDKKLVRLNNETIPDNLICFSLKSLKKATKEFATVIRKNGFATTYKGNFVDGSRVVVMVYDNSRYSDGLDFDLMVKIMSTIRHQNVIQLIGYCDEGDHFMLVHNFFGDYSLDQYMFSDSKMEGADLDWSQRVSICHGIVRALDYLHNGASPCVVHRDLKPSNVFIDSSLNPIVVGFELARNFEEGDLDQSGFIVGTYGYLDPEYVHTGRYTDKSDVYAFGITLLEIISGRKSTRLYLDGSDTNLVDWCWDLRDSGRILEIIDFTLSEVSEDEVMRFVNIALSCVQLSSELRPSISQIRLMLLDGYDFSSLALTRPNLDELMPVRLSNDSSTIPNLPQNIICFSFQSLENATNDFSNIVRRNRFSSSYNGTLDDGSKVVVKVYDTPASIDFFSMIEIMSELKHQNVVQLIGYCLEHNHQMLVHEYVGDYSLDQLMFSNSNVEVPVLNWGKRVSICHGIACSLEYLHSGCSPSVILGDVRPGNVFVDSNFNPKIVDFEVACLDKEGEADQSSLISGASGSLDLEYTRARRCSKETDIYDFGITLLEIISGRKSLQFLQDHEGTSLVDWAWEIEDTGRILEIVDPTLSEFPEYEVWNFVNVALSCVQSPSELRPAMSEIRLMLSVGFE